MKLRIALVLFALAAVSAGWAASPAIGVAITPGSLRVDDARVIGNGTLFEGTTVETSETSGQLRLTNGVQMRLASSSRGTVFRDRLVLERGAGQIESPDRFVIEAKGLRILAEGPEAAGRVAVTGDHTVQVAALRGHFRVLTADGVTVAAMPAGKTLAFDAAQAGAAAPWSMTGCLIERNGRYLLRDEITGVTVEVRGAGLATSAGNQVAITGVVVPGVQAAEGAGQIIQVSTVRQTGEKCSSPPGAARPARSAAKTAASGKKKAVIAGVVVAAAGAGAGIGLTRPAEQPPTISR
jgi:hypothetical protein